jgi:hypothetical protein
MRRIELQVRPLATGWIVETRAQTQPLLFFHGGAAERAADRLARAFSQGGAEVQMRVLDRSERMVGSRRYSAAVSLRVVTSEIRP